MDLLGGYGSDDGSSDEETNHVEVSMPPPPRRGRPPASISKRGKKLVSLHAILPPHILEQLTNGGDDSDEDDRPNVTKARTETKSKKITKRGADEGLTSLLSALSAVQKKTTLNTSKSTSKPEKMGAAFLQTHTTVVSRTKHQDVSVSKAVKVETVDGGEEGEAQIQTTTRNIVDRVNHSLAPAPRRQATSVNVPRPPTFHSAPLPAYKRPDTIDAIRQSSYNPIDTEPQVIPANQRVAKKRSRREMEKALRSGNLTAIDGQAGIHTLASDANVYMPQEESFNTAQASGVRVAPVAMYDTKAGQDVMGAGVSGKAKGKNQINHLMASAAAFEANQAQQTKLKTHRANAKSKYGW